jgi:hypothetical protein
MEQGELESLGADEQVVPLAEPKQLRSRVHKLERLFGQRSIFIASARGPERHLIATGRAILRNSTVDYAADTKDHTVSDTFVRLLRGGKAA